MKTHLTVSLIFEPAVWDKTDSFEKDFAAFLRSLGLEGTRLHSPGSMSMEICKAIEPAEKPKDTEIQSKPVGAKLNEIIEDLASLPRKNEKGLRIYKNLL